MDHFLLKFRGRRQLDGDSRRTALLQNPWMEIWLGQHCSVSPAQRAQKVPSPGASQQPLLGTASLTSLGDCGDWEMGRGLGDRLKL